MWALILKLDNKTVVGHYASKKEAEIGKGKLLSGAPWLKSESISIVEEIIFSNRVEVYE